MRYVLEQVRYLPEEDRLIVQWLPADDIEVESWEGTVALWVRTLDEQAVALDILAFSDFAVADSRLIRDLDFELFWRGVPWQVPDLLAEFKAIYKKNDPAS